MRFAMPAALAPTAAAILVHSTAEAVASRPFEGARPAVRGRATRRAPPRA
jgi:hypothetical protein